MNVSIRNCLRASALVLMLAGFAIAADQSAIRVSLQPRGERKPAPAFALNNSSGKRFNSKNTAAKSFFLISGRLGVSDARRKSLGLLNSRVCTVPRVSPSLAFQWTKAAGMF